MGTSRSWAELDHKLSRLASEAENLPKEVVDDDSRIAQKSTQMSLPSALRGVAKNKSIHVRRIESSAPGGAQATVFPAGPAHLVEGDIKAHVIPKRGGDGARVVIPGGAEGGVHGPRGVRNRVKHPGTKGKHLWSKGVASALPLMNRVLETRGAAALRRIF